MLVQGRVSADYGTGHFGGRAQEQAGQRAVAVQYGVRWKGCWQTSCSERGSTKAAAQPMLAGTYSPLMEKCRMKYSL